jgi:hypothetical protein
MIHGNVGRFGATRTLVLIGLLAIGLVAITTSPAPGFWDLEQNRKHE